MTYGTVNADVIGTSVSGSNLGAGNASIMKNRIINGSMTVDQRNAGASVTPTDNTYTLDRYKFRLSQASKLTCQQNAGSVTPPVGFSKYLGVTSSSAYSVGSGDYFILVQDIEGFNTADLGFGTASAKTVTLSFQVYSSLTGTFSGALRNSNADRSYPFTYTVSSANIWTTASVTIAGDTTGTWVGATNGAGLSVIFNLGCGSTFTSSAGSWQAGNYTGANSTTSVVGTSGATFYITGVQLEVGSSATGFEYRVYSTELSNCQRYYESTISIGETTTTCTGQPFRVAVGAYSSSSYYGPVVFKVYKRASPTITFYDDARNAGYLQGYGSVSNSLAATAQNISQSSCTGSIAVTGYNFVQGNWTASAEL
jgi:hypothetical protein